MIGRKESNTHHCQRRFVLSRLSLGDRHRLHLPLSTSVNLVVHKLTRVRVEACVEEGTVSEALIRVLLDDLPKVELATGGPVPLGPSTALSSLMRAELLQLGAPSTPKLLQLKLLHH